MLPRERTPRASCSPPKRTPTLRRRFCTSRRTRSPATPSGWLLPSTSKTGSRPTGLYVFLAASPRDGVLQLSPPSHHGELLRRRADSLSRLRRLKMLRLRSPPPLQSRSRPRSSPSSSPSRPSLPSRSRSARPSPSWQRLTSQSNGRTSSTSVFPLARSQCAGQLADGPLFTSPHRVRESQQLVAPLSPTDFVVNNALLQTAHSIFRRYAHRPTLALASAHPNPLDGALSSAQTTSSSRSTLSSNTFAHHTFPSSRFASGFYRFRRAPAEPAPSCSKPTRSSPLRPSSPARRNIPSSSRPSSSSSNSTTTSVPRTSLLSLRSASPKLWHSCSSTSTTRRSRRVPPRARMRRRRREISRRSRPRSATLRRCTRSGSSMSLARVATSDRSWRRLGVC